MPNPINFVQKHADVEFANAQFALTEQRLQVATADLAFYQKQRQLWLRAICEGVDNALFDLMISGISHRRYLKFIRAFEAL